MKKSIWLPLLLFFVGAGFYVYQGIEYNAWMKNLSLMIVDAIICVALFFAQRKKEKMEEESQKRR